MPIKVNLATLIGTNQPFIQLANSPLPPKAKYWLGRIAKVAHGHLMDYDEQRIALIKKMGQPVRQEPQPDIEIDGVMTQQPPKTVVVTDPAEIANPATMWEVPEAMNEEFFKLLDELQAQEVEIKFDKVKLSALGDAPIQVNLAALEWVIDEA